MNRQAKLLKRIRKSHNLTQPALEKILKIKSGGNFISRIELGKCHIPVMMALRLSKFAGMDPSVWKHAWLDDVSFQWEKKSVWANKRIK